MTQHGRSQSQERFSACGEAYGRGHTDRPRQTCFYGFRIKSNVKIKLIPRRPRFNSLRFIFTHRTHNNKKKRNISGEIIYIYSSANFPLLAPVIHCDVQENTIVEEKAQPE